MAEPITETKEKKNILKSLWLIFKWMGRFWPLLLLSFGFLYIVTYLRTLIPLFTQHIIDVILQFSDKGSRLPAFLVQLISSGTLANQLLFTALLLLFVDLLRALAIFMRRTVSAYFTERVAYNLRNNLYRKLQNLSFHYHAHAKTGDLIQRATTDVETYKHFIGDQIVEVMRLILLVSLSIWQMSKLNTNMTWISVLITPIIFTIAVFYFRRVEKQFTKIEEDESRMTTHVQENVSGTRVVKAFANESFEVSKFEKLNRTFTESDYKLVKSMAGFWSVTDFICFAQFCLISVFGIIYTSRGEISIGEYGAFLLYAGNIIWPMRQLGRLVGDFSKATVAVTRLNEIMATPDEYVSSVEQITPEIKGEVVFDKVSFQFSDSTYHQLEEISFTAKKGETIAIIGKTGSGKSTLMNLMVRLLDHQQGQILIDGYDLRTIEKHHLRNQIGIILQEPFLFSRTVAENIKIADQLSSHDRVQEVAKIAKIHTDISGFEKGYDTLVGERGVTLSGGQKQRVAIARMLLKPKPILIFDDSLSAVDSETDQQIRSALKKEWKQSTVFIITHRITTAKEADRILVLDQGKIVESGTHDELIAKVGLYNTIWNIQSTIDLQVEGGGFNE
ncbi:MAG: ABC transporter ATP-binding protein [bacterium]|nr:ABC transporter ATP-binding protein [bacterium]